MSEVLAALEALCASVNENPLAIVLDENERESPRPIRRSGLGISAVALAALAVAFGVWRFWPKPRDVAIAPQDGSTDRHRFTEERIDRFETEDDPRRRRTESECRAEGESRAEVES